MSDVPLVLWMVKLCIHAILWGLQWLKIDPACLSYIKCHAIICASFALGGARCNLLALVIYIFGVILPCYSAEYEHTIRPTIRTEYNTKLRIEYLVQVLLGLYYQ